MTLRIGSLFSGYGGLDMAAAAFFGAEVAWHADIDPAASRILAHHWPDIPNLGDITVVDWAAVEPVDIITGGFPCQDVSAAGLRAGIADGTRSGLWREMLAAVATIRPRYVVIENVKGLLSARAHRPVEPGPNDLGNYTTQPPLRALGAVLGDLSDIGYDAQWLTLPAAAVDACHLRNRVFILATTADTNASDIADRDAVGDAERQIDITDGVTLLPTPTVADGSGGHLSRSGDRRSELLLPGVVRAAARGELLPTPNASDGTGGGQHPDKRTGHSRQLIDYALLSDTATWGRYAGAIARQEAASRPAPSPTEPNTRGNPRLAAAFSEWMMFLPAGHVTDPAIGISRNDQLHAIGNGVVPPQAFEALRRLWSFVGAVPA